MSSKSDDLTDIDLQTSSDGKVSSNTITSSSTSQLTVNNDIDIEDESKVIVDSEIIQTVAEANQKDAPDLSLTTIRSIKNYYQRKRFINDQHVRITRLKRSQIRVTEKERHLVKTKTLSTLRHLDLTGTDRTLTSFQTEITDRLHRLVISRPSFKTYHGSTSAWQPIVTRVSSHSLPSTRKHISRTNDDHVKITHISTVKK